MAQALHAVPPVPAAPAEVFEAHLVGEKEERRRARVSTSEGLLRELPACPAGEGAGIPGGLCAVRRHGLGEHFHP